MPHATPTDDQQEIQGFATVQAAQTTMLETNTIDVEVDILHGLHAFKVVGLAGKAVEESRDRVSAAIKNASFKTPKKKNQKIVIALAPADLKKSGPVFDLAIALAYLLADEQIDFDPENTLFLGELSLDGKLRAIDGALPLAQHAKAEGFKQIVLPAANAREAALVDEIDVLGADSLRQVVDHFDASKEHTIEPTPHTTVEHQQPDHAVDFADVQGNETAKRGLKIAAAGGHNILLYGPPGTGKTMLARAFNSILPPLDFKDILEVTGIHSAAGEIQDRLVTHPPFRAPHHTASYVAVAGGGQVPKPGEVTLAHKGVLFLDEFPEFSRRVIEALRQPLEDKLVRITRSRAKAEFPANFILLAAMNPCPCGNFGSESEKCTCSPRARNKYTDKISGPIMDRIDMWIEVAEVDHEQLAEGRTDEKTSAAIQKQVADVRSRQKSRYTNDGFVLNSDMSAADIDEHIDLSDQLRTLLTESANKLDLSARAHHKTVKLARTIADLEEEEDIQEPHLMEALQYRKQIDK